MTTSVEVYGSGTPVTSGTTWANPAFALGLYDSNKATFTTATANAVGYIDIPVSVVGVPVGATINSVAIRMDGYASSDSVMPYTTQPFDGATALGTPQGANAGTYLTFTGVTYANLAGLTVRVKATHNNSGTSGVMSVDGIAVTVDYTAVPSDLVGWWGTPAALGAVVVDQSYSDIYTMGTPLNVLGAPSNAWEIEYSGVNPVVAGDGTITCSAPASATAYRSEVIFVSDGTDGRDYTYFRFMEGQRVHIAFDVMTHGLNAQDSGNWNSIWQSLGPAVGGNWPYTPLTITIENGYCKVGGGQALTYSEKTPRTVHVDDVWVRWELDILLGRAGTGSVSVWKDGVQIANAWKPTSGTYYGGTGNNAVDLQWMYFKNGLYGGASTSPQPVSAAFHNRRFSVVSVDGLTTTTWIGPTQ